MAWRNPPLKAKCPKCNQDLEYSEIVTTVEDLAFSIERRKHGLSKSWALFSNAFLMGGYLFAPAAVAECAACQNIIMRDAAELLRSIVDEAQRGVAQHGASEPGT